MDNTSVVQYLNGNYSKRMLLESLSTPGFKASIASVRGTREIITIFNTYPRTFEVG